MAKATAGRWTTAVAAATTTSAANEKRASQASQPTNTQVGRTALAQVHDTKTTGTSGGRGRDPSAYGRRLRARGSFQSCWCHPDVVRGAQWVPAATVPCTHEGCVGRPPTRQRADKRAPLSACPAPLSPMRRTHWDLAVVQHLPFQPLEPLVLFNVVCASLQRRRPRPPSTPHRFARNEPTCARDGSRAQCPTPCLEVAQALGAVGCEELLNEVFGVGVKVGWELNLAGKNLFVDAKGVIVKERRIPSHVRMCADTQTRARPWPISRATGPSAAQQGPSAHPASISKMRIPRAHQSTALP